MKKQSFFLMIILSVCTVVKSPDMTKKIDDQVKLIDIDPNYYIATFKRTGSEIEDIIEIFKQKDVEKNCGVLDYSFLGRCEMKNLLCVYQKERNKVCAFLMHRGLSSENGYVQFLATHEDYRKLGLASSLLQSVEDLYRTKQSAFLSLYVHSDNQSAIDFYKKQGFQRGF